MSKTIRINSQELADLQLIMSTYEKKIAKQSNGEKAVTLMYRPLENTEIIFSDVYNTIDPDNTIGKSLNKASSILGDVDRAINENTSGAIQNAFEQLYKSGKGADRRAKVNAGPLNITSQNTVAGIINAFNEGDIGKGFSVLLNDCIPCDLRFEAMKFTPDISFMDQLIRFAVDFISQIKDLALDLVGPPPEEADLCANINLLNFTCIPDLNALSILLAKGITVNLNLPTFQLPGLGDIVSMIIVPIIGIFANLSQLWMNIVIKPIDCLIRAVETLLKKLTIQSGTTGAAINTNIKNSVVGIQFKASAGLSPKQLADYNKNFISPVKITLETIVKFIKKIRNQVANAFQKITAKFVSAQNQGLKSILGLTTSLKEVLKILSILKMITLLKTIFGTKINTCNTKEDAIRKTQKDATNRLADAGVGKSFLKSENGQVSVNKEINITEPEAKALGFIKENFTDDDIILDINNPSNTDNVTIRLGRFLPKDNCELFSTREQFASVDRMIESF